MRLNLEKKASNANTSTLHMAPMLAVVACALSGGPGLCDPPEPPRLYLGQGPPGLTATVFAPGLISETGFHLHSSLALSPDGNDIYFTRIVFDPETQGTIWRVRRETEGWGPPQVAPFSGVYNDDSAVFSPDGDRIYFTSSRPVHLGDAPGDLNFWFVERESGGWGEAVYAGETLNSDYCDFRLSFTRDGTVYLSSDRESQESGTFDVFVSRRSDSGYSPLEKLGPAVNTPVTEQVAFVAPDEKYLVFYRHDRQQTDETGLYVSFRDADGTWRPGRNMGPTFNAPPEAITQAASLSPDGKQLFFLRRRHEAIYWVDVTALTTLAVQP